MENPQKYNNIQEFMVAHGFTPTEKGFVKGSLTIPPQEWMGHSVTTFAEKCSRKGWLQEIAASTAAPPYSWGMGIILEGGESLLWARGYPAVVEEFYQGKEG